MKYRIDMIVDVPDDWDMTSIEDEIADSLMTYSDIDVYEYVDIYEL